MTKKLVVAFGLAAIAMASLWLYARTLRDEREGGDKVRVLAAAVEIPAKTRLTRANIAIAEIPQAWVDPRAVLEKDLNQILGQPLAVQVKQSQPLLWSDFEMQKAGASAGLATTLQKGQRAITLPVDASGSLGGMLRPGDHVDVLGTFARSQGSDWATVTLLQNVLVLATGSERGDGASSNRSFSNITVAVDLEEAELLVFAMQRGPINVALRSRDDIETIDDVPDKNFGDIFETQKRTAFARRHAQKKIEALKSQ
jgi:pilus assembly protein CpaB